ncbi:Holliday junction resolvase RuvX [Candidatus Gottesmanbacteria bacterium]|nr:Holliday junction resolvase RuvX [Candidatus Gottesmanbacteria bacterium]
MSILALDFGQKKIGVAISYFAQLTKPFGVYSRKEFLKKVAEIIKTQNVTIIIIGLPEGKVQDEVYSFGAILEKNFGIKPFFIDETLTSQEAQKELIIKGIRRKTRKKLEDAYAACLILEKYLSEKNHEKLTN